MNDNTSPAIDAIIERIRNLVGEEAYAEMSRFDAGLMRDLCLKISEDIQRVILQTVSLPSLSQRERMDLLQAAAIVGVDAYATAWRIMGGEKSDKKQARRQVLLLLLLADDDEAKAEALRDPETVFKKIMGRDMTGKPDV